MRNTHTKQEWIVYCFVGCKIKYNKGYTVVSSKYHILTNT